MRRERPQVGRKGYDQHVTGQSITHVYRHDERWARRVRVGRLAWQLDGPDLSAPGEGGPPGGAHGQSRAALWPASESHAASSARSSSDSWRT